MAGNGKGNGSDGSGNGDAAKSKTLAHYEQTLKKRRQDAIERYRIRERTAEARRVTKRKQAAFCRAYSRTLDQAAAARVVGVSPRTVQYWRRKFEAFEQAYQEAKQAGLSHLEDLATKIAFEGDPQMIRFLLASEMPDRYGYQAAARDGEGSVSPESVAEAMRKASGMLDNFAPPPPPQLEDGTDSDDVIDVEPEPE